MRPGCSAGSPDETLMDFNVPTHIQELVQRVRAFVYDELIPLESTLLHDGFAAVLPALREKREQVRQLGLWAPALPADWGGMGLSLTEFAHISEILAHSPVGHYVFNVQAPDIGNMEILMMFGTPAQKETYLRPVAEGRIRSCFSMTEPGRAGSNPTWLETTAVRDGDTYVINGHKWFTTAAHNAAFAIVMAVTNPDAPSRHQRASMLIVPTDAPGFVEVRRIPIMGDVGTDHHSHSEILYENVRVPVDHLLGPEGAGFAIAQERLGPGRIHHCMRWIGISERALDLMCRRAVEREVAPGRSLADQQTIQFWIAESRAAINAARLMVLETAHKIDAGGAHHARVEISTIKFYVADIMLKVLDRAIQVHGALGTTEDIPLSFWYRHERGARIYDGPDEVHKMVVSREVLKPYR